MAAGYDLLVPTDQVDISFILAGKSRATDGATKVNYLIDNIAEIRKDCIVFASVTKESAVNNDGGETEDCVAFADRTSSKLIRILRQRIQVPVRQVQRPVPLDST
jgi:hypothetical protein